MEPKKDPKAAQPQKPQAPKMDPAKKTGAPTPPAKGPTPPPKR